VEPIKPHHLPHHQTTHLIVVNYFEFQDARPTKRPTKRPKYKEKKESPLPKGKEHLDKIETDPQAVKLAYFLKSSILSENGQRKTPTDKQLTLGHHAWARVLRLMMEIDKRTPQEIHNAITWLYTINPAQEARFVVLSAAALRTKYDAIVAAMQRTGHATKPPRSPPTRPPPQAKSETLPKDPRKPPKRAQKPPWW
jgi:hypothetical protein